jgi:hypothetical protein
VSVSHYAFKFYLIIPATLRYRPEAYTVLIESETERGEKERRTEREKAGPLQASLTYLLVAMLQTGASLPAGA